MKRFASLLLALTLGLTLSIGNAEAARIGGGRSLGMQRQVTPMTKPTPMASPAAAPTAAAKPTTAATPTAQTPSGSRSWLGPIAGLAAGLGLAALASHFGFGEGLANIMMIALIGFAVMAVIGFFLRKRSENQSLNMANVGSNYNTSTHVYETSSYSNASPTTSSKIPADFDRESFIRNAKVGFIRLQAANDAGDLADIREFTSPEMFAEIRLDLEQRNGAPQRTDIISLNAEILDVDQDSYRYIASVRFTGTLREEADAAPVSIDEVWNLTKPINGQGGWVLAGIQQTQ